MVQSNSTLVEAYVETVYGVAPILDVIVVLITDLLNVLEEVDIVLEVIDILVMVEILNVDHVVHQEVSYVGGALKAVADGEPRNRLYEGWAPWSHCCKETSRAMAVCCKVASQTESCFREV